MNEQIVGKCSKCGGVVELIEDGCNNYKCDCNGDERCKYIDYLIKCRRCGATKTKELPTIEME